MIEIVVALLSAVTGLFAYRAFTKSNADKGQEQLEMLLKPLREEAKQLEEHNARIKREKQEKIDAISKQQKENPTGADLADFFDKRNGK
jgi:hypothetical protein